MDKITQINKLFTSFNIKASVSHIYEGLRTNRYYINLELGERVSKVKNLQNELALLTRSITLPTFCLKPDSGHLVMETTINDSILSIQFNDIVVDYSSSLELPLVLGKTMDNKTFEIDLASAPHLLIAGTTGSGKSVITNTIIKSLQHHLSTEELQLAFIDPKQIELIKFADSEYAIDYSSSINGAYNILQNAIDLMNDRYKLMSLNKIDSFKMLNKLDKHIHPYIVIVIDELADLLIQDKNNKLFSHLVRLLQKSRAAGIHVICNTQRPSRDVIKGLLRANLPVQIALKTTSALDSRIIIGSDGAESLVGKGDMLVNCNGQITRVQAAI